MELNRPSLAEENVDLTQPLKIAARRPSILLRRVGDAMSVAYIVHEGVLKLCQDPMHWRIGTRTIELAYIMPTATDLQFSDHDRTDIAPDQWKINGGESNHRHHRIGIGDPHYRIHPQQIEQTAFTDPRRS